MRKLQVVLIVIGVVQIVLGLLYLFMPLHFLAFMGIATTEADIAYPLGMLAARFLAYGAGMFFVARDPVRNLFWVNNMIFIQAVDLAVGVYYTATGVVDLQNSAFPMFNAAMFIILLTLWRPKATTAVVNSGQLSRQ
jgi:hypothetical protein